MLAALLLAGAFGCQSVPPQQEADYRAQAQALLPAAAPVCEAQLQRDMSHPGSFDYAQGLSFEKAVHRYDDIWLRYRATIRARNEVGGYSLAEVWCLVLPGPNDTVEQVIVGF
jgi:hypothetical protein